jgi:putative transposase
MARLARIVVPGLPHHVTARGNRREPIFFEDGDQEIYLDLLAEQMRKARVSVWAYCLMPNHIHLIACPTTADGLALALGAAHRRWANFVNARGRWRGHLFDGRFASVAMDEAHLWAAIRYVALNPVRARLTTRAPDWPWCGDHGAPPGRGRLRREPGTAAGPTHRAAGAGSETGGKAPWPASSAVTPNSGNVAPVPKFRSST